VVGRLNSARREVAAAVGQLRDREKVLVKVLGRQAALAHIRDDGV